MSFRTTFRLFLAACIVGIVIWVARERLETTEQKSRRAKRLLGALSWRVSELVIDYGDSSVELRHRPGGWRIVRPIHARADSGQVARILSILEESPRRDVVSPAQRLARELTLAHYGLTPPRARFVLGDGGTRALAILVGDPAPLGSLVYTRVGESGDVIATGAAITNAIPKGIEQLRDRRLLVGDPSRTSRLEIECRDRAFVQLRREQGSWVLQQPVTGRADGRRVDVMLEELYRLEATGFVWDRQQERRDGAVVIDDGADMRAVLETHGLASDQSFARVKVWGIKDEVGQELILGNLAGEGRDARQFARVDGIDSIYTVPGDLLSALAVEPAALRDRFLFRTRPRDVKQVRIRRGEKKLLLARTDRAVWQIVEPVQWPADQDVVDRFVTKIAGWQAVSFGEEPVTNLAALGLASPFCSVRFFADSSPAGPGEARTGGATRSVAPVPLPRLLIGSPRHDSVTTSAMFEGGGPIYMISGEDVAVLGKAPTDPLSYRSRTMLGLSPEHVIRMSLVLEGKELAAERDGSGGWVATAPAAHDVDLVAVSDVLFLVANLRAESIEAHNPPSLAPFGLNDDRAILTLGLTGDEGIQKSLIFGFRAKDRGVFAMVRGQDVVFVLRREIVDRLVSSIVKPRPQ